MPAMRIALVSGNREIMPDAVIPLGLLYVQASIPERHQTALWDLCFEAEPLTCLRARITEFAPDVVAIGMRNIQNNDYTGYHDNLNWYADILATVRSCTRAPTVLGGGGFSVMPVELMAHLRPDFGISGEGEAAFACLLQALERGDGDFSGVPNLHRLVADGLGRERVHSNPPAARFQDLDALPVPDRRLVDPRHFANYRIDSVQTKRGCSLKCDYCTYPTIEGKAVRRRDPARIVDEMFQSLERQPEIRHVFVVDSVFNLPPSHAKEICRQLAARGWQVPWTAYANPLAFDRELADLLHAANCAGLEIGADSGVDVILDRMRKGFSLADVRKMDATCKAAGVKDCMTFILGTPGETLDDVRATLDFCTDLDPFAAIMMVWMDDYESLDAALAAQRRVFREQIKDLMRQKAEAFPRWIIPALGVNFDARLFGLLRAAGKAAPLWQYIDMVGRDRRSARLRRQAAAAPG